MSSGKSVIAYRHAELPVIMVTAGVRTVERTAAFDQGANDYLTKPLDAQITIARISLQLKLRRALSELKRSQERYALAAQGSRIGLWTGTCLIVRFFFHHDGRNMLGYHNEELDSTVDAWFERIHRTIENSSSRCSAAAQTLDHQRFETEIRMQHRDGTYRWMLCTGVLQIDAAGRPFRLAGSLADVTDAKVRDVLTGLPNRLLFEEQLGRALRLDPETNGLCAVPFPGS